MFENQSEGAFDSLFAELRSSVDCVAYQVDGNIIKGA